MELKNIKETRNIIELVEKKSIAEELGIQTGDILLSVNNTPIKDIIDYKYLITDEWILLEVEKESGDIWEYQIEKDFDEDLGLSFTNPLIDRAKSCTNKCIFCFVDQLPCNMRNTLYFKDDDSRLSFLQGNFITLTNMKDEDIDRIIKYRLSPINISVHTTNPELRIKMLRNRKAGKILDILKRFHEAKLEVNCQIVLVPGVNDGDELDRSLRDLSSLYPTVKSLAVVPIGITKFREGLEKVTAFDKELSDEFLSYVLNIQNEFLESLGTRFVFPSDEFFALSKMELPSYEAYENFPQLENGVGLMKLFKHEILQELENINTNGYINKTYTIVTGTLAYEYMKDIAKEIMKKFTGLKLEVKSIVNNYFGDKITVSGLITGRDLMEQLKEIKTDKIIMPSSMLKSDEEVLLDDIRPEDITKELGREIIVSDVSGKDFVDIFRNEVS